MALQNSRTLVSNQRIVFAGQTDQLKGFQSYLIGRLPQVLDYLNTFEDFLKFDIQDKILRWVAMYVISNSTKRLDEETLKVGANKAWNNCSVDLVESSRVHCNYYMFTCFESSINQSKQSRSAEAIDILEKLRSLYALKLVESTLTHSLAGGLLNQKSVSLLHCAIRSLYSVIRVNAVALVDAFEIPDFVLNSVIGRKDGNIYEAYFDRVRNNVGVAPYFEKLIKPMVDQTLSSNL